MKLANPFHYSSAMLMGAIALVIGVRGLHLPKGAAVPMAAAIAVGTATLLKSRQSPPAELANPLLEQELQTIHQQAHQLAQTAKQLRIEATQLLTQANQIELLRAVQSACDRVQELPTRLIPVQPNMQLSQQEQDARLADVFSLSTLLSDASRVLQSLQTKLHTIDFSNRGETLEVRSLSCELTKLQEGLDLLIVQ
ncbi:MAG: hypothetical protein HC881_13520 [Leptolyngbyaceae cyanobacterium SL_7_1]|nr:hypothetical protein [Leptolyngbyaceae cyanobacterium SL_7_1]